VGNGKWERAGRCALQSFGLPPCSCISITVTD